MSGIVIAELLATTLLREWLAWQERQQRPQGYRWTDADIQAFLGRIEADTPEKIKAEAAGELGR